MSTTNTFPNHSPVRAYVAADKSCDLCGDLLRSGTRFYDARVPGWSSWAWCCSRCFRNSGATLGLGRGQEYDSKTDEKLRG